MSATHSNGVNGVTHKVNGMKLDTARSRSRDARASPAVEDGASPASTTSSGRPAHLRKESNPLAPPFIISAPGKTIVYGEHAVVHGKAAIAAAISLRSYLLVTTLSKSKRTVRLRFVDLDLDHTWNIPDLPWKIFQHPSKKKKYYDLVTSLDKELVEAMQPHIANISPHVEPHTRKVHQGAAAAFLYLFLSLGSEHSPPCIYTLRSTIPIGAGLGSSASVSVCFSTALLIQCRALAGPHPDQMSKEAEEQLERINRWAFVGELLIHGNPSGVDNTVATNGHAVLFQRKDYTKPPLVSILRDFPELPLLLVDTCQPKSTAAEVAKVGALKTSHPTVTDNILNAIDSITRSAHDIITHGDFEDNPEDNIRHLGELMTVNHGLLTSLGVSHPKLERLRYLVDQAGVGWTKLTGAGGGGCAITLLRPSNPAPSQQSEKQSNGDTDQLNGEAAYTSSSCSYPPSQSFASRLQSLDVQLETEGFQKFQTTLGGDGVGVLYPAVLHGEEIDQESFLTAEGSEGVEELVGAARGRNDEEGASWSFWRP